MVFLKKPDYTLIHLKYSFNMIELKSASSVLDNILKISPSWQPHFFSALIKDHLDKPPTFAIPWGVA